MHYCVFAVSAACPSHHKNVLIKTCALSFQGMVLVLLEAHQRLSASFQNFKSFRAKKAAASAHQFAALDKANKTSRSSNNSLPAPTPGLESDALDGLFRLVPLQALHLFA